MSNCDRDFDVRLTVTLRHVKSTRLFRLSVASLFEFLLLASFVQVGQGPFSRIIAHGLFTVADVCTGKSAQLTDFVTR